MNIYDEIYNEAFNDELEKCAAKAKLPKRFISAARDARFGFKSGKSMKASELSKIDRIDRISSAYKQTPKRTKRLTRMRDELGLAAEESERMMDYNLNRYKAAKRGKAQFQTHPTRRGKRLPWRNWKQDTIL